jgi:hypothetical protein
MAQLETTRLPRAFYQAHDGLGELVDGAFIEVPERRTPQPDR